MVGARPSGGKNGQRPRVVVQTAERPTAAWRRWWQWLLRPCERDEAVVGCGRKDGGKKE